MSESGWIWQCDHMIPSSPGAGRGVLEEVLRQLQRQCWIEHDIFGVHLAMEEALTNAIKHGNRSDASKHIHVSCRLNADLVHIEIADQGPGFDPTTIPDPTDSAYLDVPGGRGLMLMRSFMSRVQYNATGNCVVMEKDRGARHS
jgi:serine/threonine-protein kinase RsbW